MAEIEFGNLFAVTLIAFLAPLLLGFAPRIRIPAVLLEISAGIAVGPSGLGWVEIDPAVEVVALVGLAFLLFLAGLEIDPGLLRGPVLAAAAMGYVITIGLGTTAGGVFQAVGWVDSALLLGITLSATSLGLVVPVLKDAGKVNTQTGRLTIAAASVADFAAVILLSLLFSTSDSSTGARTVLLVAFAVLVAVAGIAVWLAGRSMRLGEVLVRLQDTTAEIRVRAAVVLLVAFVALAEKFGLESILGAFLAGAVVGMLDRDTSSHPRFRAKLDAIGYGFVIPVFFVTSGLRLDVGAVFESGSGLARVPIFLVALLVVRGVPALLFVREIGGRAAFAAALLQATSLPFIVTATQIGVLTGRMEEVTAVALTCAGLLSVLLFPVLALAVLRPVPADRRPPPAASDTRLVTER